MAIYISSWQGQLLPEEVDTLLALLKRIHVNCIQCILTSKLIINQAIRIMDTFNMISSVILFHCCHLSSILYVEFLITSPITLYINIKLVGFTAPLNYI